MPEIDYSDHEAIVELLAKLAAPLAPSVGRYFRNLMRIGRTSGQGSGCRPLER